MARRVPEGQAPPSPQAADRRGAVGRDVAALLGQTAQLSGRQVVCLSETTSTNDVARALALDGAPHGTIVIADSQTAGRGRLGRMWFSPPGLGLWCTFILRPQAPLARLGPLPLVAALAAAEAIRSATGLSCRLKWPNDLVIGDRKIGGILSESSAPAGPGPPEFVLLGIGINVGQSAGDFPEELRGKASSLRLEGARTSPSQVGAALVVEFDRLYGLFLSHGFGRLRDRWLAAANWIGRAVRISGSGETVSGLAEGVDEDGRLLVRLHSGRVVPVAAGDVSLRPDSDSSQGG